MKHRGNNKCYVTGVIYACRLQLVMPNVINHKTERTRNGSGPAPSILSSELVIGYSVFTGNNCIRIAMENCCQVDFKMCCSRCHSGLVHACLDNLCFFSSCMRCTFSTPYEEESRSKSRPWHGRCKEDFNPILKIYSRDDNSFAYLQGLMFTFFG